MIFAFAALAALTALIAAVRPAAAPTLHVSGDGAGSVRAMLGDVPMSADASAARVEAVLLRRLESLRHVPGLQAACRGRCADEPVTALIRLDPGHVRKTLVIHLGAMGAGASIDAGGPLAPDVVACVAAMLRLEMATWRPEPPPCIGGARRQIMVLPWGL